MNREVLDRLLVDRALGALDPDVGELLSAYLETDEGAARRAREFSQATELARRALGSADNTTLPPFPAAALAAAERSRRLVRLVTRAASLAACLLLGIAVGAWALRPAAHERNTGGLPAGPRGTVATDNSSAEHVAPAHPVHPLAVVHAGTKPEQGFWSAQRLYEQAQKAPPPRPSQVQWISPVREPRIGGA